MNSVLCQRVFYLTLVLCFQPALPLTAVCAICKEGYQGSEDSESVQTLMECSECAQITHPECIKVHVHVCPTSCLYGISCYMNYVNTTYILQVPGEGIINKDLPSCWECPKCVQGKKTEVCFLLLPYFFFCLFLFCNKSSRLNRPLLDSLFR